MSDPKKWLKKDVRTMTGILDTFWLLRRPLTMHASDQEAAKKAIREILSDDGARKNIVLAGLRSARETAATRYCSHCEVIGNQLVRFTEYGKPDETIERFTKFAREEDEAQKKLEALVLRVNAEALPPEVLAHDPTEEKR